MYWNLSKLLVSGATLWLIVTWDVLKRGLAIFLLAGFKWLIVTWDVLKRWYKFPCFCFPSRINSNMRCIETSKAWRNHLKKCRLIVTWDVLKQYQPACCLSLQSWLIVTWDVLKRNQFPNFAVFFMINSNMRCIETYPLYTKLLRIETINSNMRCIETWLCRLLCTALIRLIVTWDVLKLIIPA